MKRNNNNDSNDLDNGNLSWSILVQCVIPCLNISDI